jgi:arylsulfatase A-like enzyme
MMGHSQPNILLIMTDQQRFDSLGCYGCDAVNTPNLDRLAAEGVLFENCVVANPVCTPSRASIWTGKDLPGHGVMRLYDNLHEDEVLFPVHLQQLGYRTGLFGKLHVSSMLAESRGRHPHDGFDAYERWKLCYYHSSDEGELYDMHSDPEERCNLWNDPESLKVRTRLKQALDKSVSDAEFQRPPRGGENLPPANMLLSNQLVRN